MHGETARLIHLLPADNEKAQYYNFPILWSVMTAPGNPAMRRAVEAHASLFALARGVTDGGEIVEVSGDFILALANGRAMAEIAHGFEIQAARQGQIAGMVLINLYVLSRDPKVEASVKKAIHLVSKQAEIRETWAGGDKIARDSTSIRNAWRDYKSVAHIWAARALVEDFYQLKPPVSFNYARDVVEVLEWSEGFRVWAESYRQRRIKRTVAEVNELWRPSPDSMIQVRQLSAQESSISPVLAQWLVDYSAPMLI